MTTGELTALTPFITLTGAILALVLVVAFVRRHAPVFWLTLLGLAGVAATLPWTANQISGPTGVQIGDLLRIDRFTLLWCALLLAATVAVTLLGRTYWHRRLSGSEGGPDGEDGAGELYVLLLVSTLGGLVLTAATHFVTLFLGLETLSVGLYVLIAYLREGPRPIEAGLKYLILAGASSAFMLFGMALLYAAVGTMALEEIVASPGAAGPLGLAGLAMLLVGVGFKLALAPFHLWTPDVYEGAPAPVTAFVATVSKGAVFALLLRWSLAAGEVWGERLLLLLGTVAAASMILGNLLALFQSNLKRLLAYSSIAHLGYALVALVALSGAGELAAEAVIFYLAAYFVTILGAFGVVTALSEANGEAETVDHVRGLFWRRPWLAAMFTAMVLSLAGIPLTAGFLAKLYAVAAGVEAALWTLVLILILTSAVGLFYYLRVVVAMFGEVTETNEEGSRLPAVGTTAGIALITLTVILIWLGTWPEPVIHWIHAAVAGLV